MNILNEYNISRGRANGVRYWAGGWGRWLARQAENIRPRKMLEKPHRTRQSSARDVRPVRHLPKDKPKNRTAANALILHTQAYFWKVRKRKAMADLQTWLEFTKTLANQNADFARIFAKNQNANF